jgi:hypothetical protein
MNELIMLSAYLNKRIMYYRKKQGENTYYQDTIEELETVFTMVDSILDAEENEADEIDSVLARILSPGKPLSADEFIEKLNKD